MEEREIENDKFKLTETSDRICKILLDENHQHISRIIDQVHSQVLDHFLKIKVDSGERAQADEVLYMELCEVLKTTPTALKVDSAEG